MASSRLKYVKQSMNNQLQDKNNTIAQLRKELEQKNDAFMQMSERLEQLQNAVKIYEGNMVQSMKKFPTKSIQRLPFQIPGCKKIIYSTRYEPGKVDNCGIFEYNIQTGQNIALQLWEPINYYPRWNVSIYNETEHSIIFAGGVDVTKNKQKYKSIMIYNINTNAMKTIEFETTIGSNARMALTHNDKYLHIVGGSLNKMHIRYNLLSQETNIIDSFHDTMPCIISHGLLYNPLLNRLISFGGKIGESKTDAFWILDLNTKISSLTIDERAQRLAAGYMAQLIDDIGYSKNTHNMFLKYILMFLGEDIKYSIWKCYEAKRMPRKMSQFGYVLYNNRIIITFGGRTEDGSIDNIYYIDLFDDNSSWKESTITMPKCGSYNAVLVDNKTVHLLPCYEHSDHFYVNITNILPPQLLIVDKCPQCGDLNQKIKVLHNQLLQNKIKLNQQSFCKMKLPFKPIITAPKKGRTQQHTVEQESEFVLYNQTHSIIRKCNESSTYLKKMSMLNDKSLIESAANNDEKQENESMSFSSVKLFRKYSEYYTFIGSQSKMLREINTESHELELVNHQNKLSKLLTECEEKSFSNQQEYDRHSQQYISLKQQRIDMQSKITAEFEECNKLIDEENKLFQQLQNIISSNSEMHQKVKTLKSSANQCKLIMKLYNDFMADNKQYISKINKTFDRLWGEFESKCKDWSSKDVFVWFKFKTIKMNTNKIGWQNIEKQLNIRRITGKSLTKFNDLTFQLIGLQENELISYLLSEISRLETTYNKKSGHSQQAHKHRAHIPKEFICPITERIMDDPVVAFDGYSYDRIAIEQYLKTHKKSPTTGANADYMIVFPNHKLKASIKQYIETNNANMESVNEIEEVSEGDNETILL